jgi:hypothetical protein
MMQVKVKLEVRNILRLVAVVAHAAMLASRQTMGLTSARDDDQILRMHMIGSYTLGM